MQFLYTDSRGRPNAMHNKLNNDRILWSCCFLLFFCGQFLLVNQPIVSQTIIFPFCALLSVNMVCTWQLCVCPCVCGCGDCEKELWASEQRQMARFQENLATNTRSRGSGAEVGYLHCLLHCSTLEGLILSRSLSVCYSVCVRMWS